jgi:hypothetical protein
MTPPRAGQNGMQNGMDVETLACRTIHIVCEQLNGIVDLGGTR